MQNLIKQIFILLLGLLLLPVASFADKGYFIHFGENEGLLNNRVQALTVDDNGFLWMATAYGLSRFDGQKFKSYTPKDYPEMQREDMLSLANMGSGRLVMGGYNGVIQIFDIAKDRFYDKMPKIFNDSYFRTVHTFTRASDGNFYAVCSDGGIYPYDERTQTFSSDYMAYKNMQFENNRSMYVDTYHRYWLGLVDKIGVYKPTGEKIYTYSSPKQLAGFIGAMVPLKDKIAVCTSVHEMWIFNTKDEKINDPKIITTPFANVISAIRDSRGRYWFATDGWGLWFTDDDLAGNPTFRQMEPFDGDPKDLTKLYGIIEDKTGIIWVATQNAGIWGFKYPNNKGFFFSNSIGLPNVVCSGFAEDKSGNLFISTDGYGIFSMTANYHNVRNYNLQNNNVLNIEKLPGTNSLVASTWGAGLLQFDMATGKASTIGFPGLDNHSSNFFNVAVLKNGTWVANSAGDGIYRKNKEDKWTRTVLIDTSINSYNYWIYKVLDGKDGSIWVLTTNNLWLIKDGQQHPLMKDFAFQKSHKPMQLLDAYCMPDGYLYVASSQGVLQVSPDGKNIARYDSTHLAGSYNIIIADETQNLWVAGSDGLSTFNPKTHFYSKCTFLNSDETNYSFYSRAGYKDSKGQLYFGTSTGFFCINPSSALSIDKIPYLAFSGLSLSHKKVLPGTSVLSKGLLGSGELELAYDQTVFSIGIDLLDFSDINQAHLRYKMQGLSDDWVELPQGSRQIDFNHLPMGHYTLVVEAYRPGSNTVDKTITLKIHVLAPWWASWWFILLMLALISAAVYAVFKVRMRNLVLARQELKQKVDERTKELRLTLADKNRIISVVAHDLKGPMYGIVSALENWLEKNGRQLNMPQRKPLTDIYSSASVLQSEMQKLLDWARSDKQSSVLTPVDIDVAQITNNIFMLLKRNADAKSITLSADFSISKYVSADIRSVETIIRNLVNNSIKFTRDGGLIRVSGSEVDGMAQIVVEDNGVGIAADKLQQLNQPGLHTSTKGTDDEIGTGLGIDLCQNYINRNGGTLKIESIEGQGSTFTFTLPLSSRDLIVVEEKESEVETKPQLDIDEALLAGNRILVVDDDDLIRETLKDRLSAYVEVRSAKNGADALEQIKETLPDVVISDISMPVMNGIELGKAIVNNVAYRHIPLLYISANNEEDDRLLGLLTGAVDYISKPFSMEELLVKLTNILRLRQNIQQHNLELLMQKGFKQLASTGKEEEKTAEKEEPQGVINPDVEKFMQLLEQHYTNCDLQIDMLASDMCMSQSTLGRRIKSLTGKTPVELLSEYRLNKAHQKLSVEQNPNIADIAFTVGYSDASYFSRKYKAYFGYLPTQTHQNTEGE